MRRRLRQLAHRIADRVVTLAVHLGAARWPED